MELTDRDLLDVVAGADLGEAVSALGGEPSPCFVTATGGLDPAEAARAAGAIRHLPAVVVVAGDPERTPPALVGAADVCTTAGDDPPRPWVGAEPNMLHAAVADQADACLALVSVLRAAEHLAPADAIAVEAAAYSMLLGSRGFHQWLEKRGPATPKPHVRPPVAVRRHGDIVRIRLQRPEARNAIDRATRDALVEALRLVALDGDVRAELSGAGSCFSSGGDLQEFGEVGDPATAFAVRLTRHPGAALAAVADRLECRLHGPCVGAGVEIPAFAARVTADPGTTFRLPEVAMGLIPGAGGTCSLARRIGRHRTAWLALTGAAIDASTARRWGLVDAVEAVEAGR